MCATLGSRPSATPPDEGRRTTAPSIVVSLGELAVSQAGELVAYSLGSCVAICLHDPIARVAGMAHVVLPTTPAMRPMVTVAPPGKFADMAVPALLEVMLSQGAASFRLHCKLAGGAAVLSIGGGGRLPNIGQRNVEAIKVALARARLCVLAEAIGGTEGRTVRLDAATGRTLVRAIHGPEVEL